MHYEPDKVVYIQGFLRKRKDVGSRMTFCDVDLGRTYPEVQIVSTWEEEGSYQHVAHQDLKTISPHSPITAMGTLKKSEKTSGSEDSTKQRFDLKLRHIKALNTFPKDIIVTKDALWPPKFRHLQLRFDPDLRDRLRFRSSIQFELTKQLMSRGFVNIETPLLFKSTPEGAREFLVPTRRPGYAYALTQSPQQYKQILMAGGIEKYFQFAKCFRDEDHRADRQPEFTQLDLEMSFASGTDVINNVSKVIEKLFNHNKCFAKGADGKSYIVYSENEVESLKENPASFSRFGFQHNAGNMVHMKYKDAMDQYGTDKPDLRIKTPWMSPIHQITSGHGSLFHEFVPQLTTLRNFSIEGVKLRLGQTPDAARKFMKNFMNNLPSTLNLTPGCTPAVFVYDSKLPLNGFSDLGEEGASVIERMSSSTWPKCVDGDIIVMHARKTGRHVGGSTDLGRLRTALYAAGVKTGFIPADRSLQFLWVHSFPLFTPDDGKDPGQGGAAGFSATHHPFTAPQTAKDVDLLTKGNPLAARGDSYDLVVNGIEIGGGSRRIHVAELQQYIMKDVLQMSNARIADFAHLLEALRAGCPPHAGFALGFDRLVTVMFDLPSIRDVMAFPKTNKGEDVMVGSPSKVTPEQEQLYHIAQHPRFKKKSQSAGGKAEAKQQPEAETETSNPAADSTTVASQEPAPTPEENPEETKILEQPTEEEEAAKVK